MRFALVSDIHANLQAWKAVELDIASLGADRIVCLGDVVGYGPNPAEVLESVYARVHHFVLGNHDAVVCGRLEPDLFTGPARRLVEWTAGRLDARARAVLSRWPLSLRGEAFRCAHGELGDPARFRYVIEPEDARPSWQVTEDRLLFVGHSHSPGIFLLGHSNTPHRVDPQDCVVDGDRRFLVNVGSVGQPRDGDARACYVLYDSERRSLRWRRIPFDLDAYRAAVGRARMPASADYFLAFDPLREARPLRTMICFRPPETEREAAQGAPAVGELGVLRRQVHRWRRAAAAAAALAALLVAAGGWAAARHAGRAVEVAGPPLPPPVAADCPAGADILRLPDPSAAAGGLPVAGWALRLGNRHAQDAVLREGSGGVSGPVLAFASRSGRDPVAFRSPPVRIEPGQRLTVSARFRKSEGFRGSVSLAVAVERDGAAGAERLEHFVVKEPNLRRRGGWYGARETFETPAGARLLVVEVRGRFAGGVEVTGLALCRRAAPE